MSDELRLPDDLAACEARLAALPLAASGLDRDAVLYQAGWAAAEAAREHVPLAGAPSRVTRSAAAGWSAASAALAASLAVAATLALQSVARVPSETPMRDVQLAVTHADDDETPTVAMRSAADRRLLAQLDALASGRLETGGRLTSLGLIGALGDRRRGEWNQPVLVSTNVAGSADGARAEAPTTAREMLEEYLPGGQRRARAAKASSSRDMLKLLNPLSWSEDTI